MPQFDPYTSSSIPSDHKNKLEDATSKSLTPASLPKPAEAKQGRECDICDCCRANTSSHPQHMPTCASPNSSCCGTSCPDRNTTTADSQSQFYSPATFHHRHANLRLQQQNQTLVPSDGESFSETWPTAKEQARELPALQHSQQEDDSIRMILAGERAEAEGVNGDEPVPGEFSKEIKMLNAGYIDTSKMC